MKTDTTENILNYIKQKKQVSPKDLAEYLGISSQTLFRQLKKLLQQNKIQKIGAPPKVFYTSVKETAVNENIDLNKESKIFLDNHFYWITPLGQIKEGASGFIWWCQNRKFPIVKTYHEYRLTIEKYDQYRLSHRLISGLYKMKNTFNKVFLEDLFYIEFYAIERFGKTKIGQILNLAKQSQNISQINFLIDLIKEPIDLLLKELDIDCIGFIPPTVKREVQIMTEFKKKLHFNLPVLTLTKIKTPIIVPQKTLSKLPDRIENANITIVVDDSRVYKNILLILIDDAVGSGATLNETARHIHDKSLCTEKIYGLAITGSFKGFEVINEI